jgi:hydrogenase expression/formation protein HypC
MAVRRRKNPRLGALIVLGFRESSRMCIGFPMTVLKSEDGVGLCERRGDKQQVSMLLIGAQAPGAKVLVYLGSAVRLLDDVEAAQIDDALDALQDALEGKNIDHRFADLIDREPELPEFLR